MGTATADPEPRRAVHVAPLGAERDRIALPAIEYGADLVVLLDYLPRTGAGRPGGGLRNLHSAVEDDLDEAGIAVDRRDVAIEDLYDAIRAVSSVVAEFAGDRVFVNVSAGDKVTAVGATMACMVADGPTAYYVVPESGGSVGPGGGPAQGMASVETVPRYPLDRPTDEQLAVMAHVEAADETEAIDVPGDTRRSETAPSRSKTDLARYAADEELPFMRDFDGETDAGKRRRLSRHVIEPLTESGFVAERAASASKRVYLTDDGRNTLRAFRHVVE